MKKETYDCAIIDVTYFDVEDVITTLGVDEKPPFDPSEWEMPVIP